MQNETKQSKTSSTVNDYLKQESNTTELCFNCHRSKRPHLDQVLDLLISFEKLEIRCYEGNALQMFVNRVLTWQDRFKKAFDTADAKELQHMVRKFSRLDAEAAEKHVDSLSS
jgi:hypothetical protein